MILEFIITPENKLVGMEMEHTTRGIKYPAKKGIGLFEVERYKDVKKWDHKQNLLLTLNVYREEKNKFLDLINKIKPYKKEIFVEYGLLSHPAILLRESGIATKPYISDYEILTFEF